MSLYDDAMESLPGELPTEMDQFFRAENQGNQKLLMSNLYLAQVISSSTKDIIQADRELADSNERYSEAMVKLTEALVFVGIAQVVVAVLQIFF